MEIWVIILLLSGSGKAIEVPPVYYETKEACIAAGRELDGWPEYRCIPGKRFY